VPTATIVEFYLEEKMTWTLLRGFTYIAMLIASLLAFAGLADFDIASGQIQIHSFNVYDFVATMSGFVSSSLASLAVFKKWGQK